MNKKLKIPRDFLLYTYIYKSICGYISNYLYLKNERQLHCYQGRAVLDFIFKLSSERSSYKEEKKGREKLSKQMSALKSHGHLQIIPLHWGTWERLACTLLKLEILLELVWRSEKSSQEESTPCLCFRGNLESLHLFLSSQHRALLYFASSISHHWALHQELQSLLSSSLPCRLTAHEGTWHSDQGISHPLRDTKSVILILLGLLKKEETSLYDPSDLSQRLPKDIICKSVYYLFVRACNRKEGKSVFLN